MRWKRRTGNRVRGVDRIVCRREAQLGIFMIISAPLSKGNLQCQDCNFNWKYPYKEKKNEEEIREK